MGRNFLAHRQGDAINAVLAAAGYNFRRPLAWLALVLRLILNAVTGQEQPKAARQSKVHGRRASDDESEPGSFFAHFATSCS